MADAQIVYGSREALCGSRHDSRCGIQHVHDDSEVFGGEVFGRRAHAPCDAVVIAMRSRCGMTRDSSFPFHFLY